MEAWNHSHSGGSSNETEEFLIYESIPFSWGSLRDIHSFLLSSSFPIHSLGWDFLEKLDAGISFSRKGEIILQFDSTLQSTVVLWRYWGFSSDQCNKASITIKRVMYFFGSPVHIKAVFTLYYNLLNVKLHGGRWKWGSGQGDTCTPVADSCQCVAKITTILESNEPQTRINKLILKKFQFRTVQSLSHVQLFETHGLQHARPPCPSPTPGVYSNSCPLSQWCHPIIWSSVVSFSSCLQSFNQSSGSFPMSQFFELGS